MVLFSDRPVGIADPLLARAFELAERGRGTTSPNPLVGCVVSRDGQVVGEGFHERAGGPHAEVVALDAAGAASRGGHVYVTLEPCNHTGRTPPCVERLLAAGVAAVTIGMPDPNSEVTGGGATALRAAGVEVAWAPDPAPFVRQNEAWLKRLATGLPFVTVKVALTLDGKPSLRPGTRSRITGEGGRAITMHLRDRSTAVAVGASTVTIDDPSLTVRGCDDSLMPRQPLRVVFARTGVPSAVARVFSDGAGPVLVLVADTASASADALACGQVRVKRYPGSEGIAGMLKALAAEGVDDVVVEAGPRLFAAFWESGAIDELVVVTAGGIGGADAVDACPLVADRAGADLAPRMRAVECAITGHDAVTVWRPLET